MSIRLPNCSPFSRETCSITINGKSLQYTVQRSTRRFRTVQLRLDPDVGLKILAPYKMSDEDINEFLVKHSEWISKHYTDFEDRKQEKDWANGGTILLRGKKIRVLVLEREADDIGRDLTTTVVKSLEGDEVTVIIPPNISHEKKSADVWQGLREWYRQEALDHLESRMVKFGKLMGVREEQLKLSNAEKRWGSCSGKGSINLNWRLIKLDDSLIDYVVVHELAHLKQLNHSANFWRVVEGVLSNYRELRMQLREHSPSTLI